MSHGDDVDRRRQWAATKPALGLHANGYGEASNIRMEGRVCDGNNLWKTIFSYTTLSRIRPQCFFAAPDPVSAFEKIPLPLKALPLAQA
jgi:hypothetical protein